MPPSLKERILLNKDNIRLLQSVSTHSIELDVSTASNASESGALDSDHHGGLQSILFKKRSDSGSLLYTVEWKDGCIAKVSPDKLRNFYKIVEAFEYDQFQTEDSGKPKKRLTKQNRQTSSKNSNKGVASNGANKSLSKEKLQFRKKKTETHQQLHKRKTHSPREGLRRTTNNRAVSYKEVTIDDDFGDKHDDSNLGSSSPNPSSSSSSYTDEEVRHLQPFKKSSSRESSSRRSSSRISSSRRSSSRRSSSRISSSRRSSSRISSSRKVSPAFETLNLSDNTDDNSDSCHSIAPPRKKSKLDDEGTVDTPKERHQIKRATTIFIAATTSLKNQHAETCSICAEKGEKISAVGGIVDITDKHTLIPCRYCSNSTHPACCTRDDAFRSCVVGDTNTKKPTGSISQSPPPYGSQSVDVPSTTGEISPADQPSRHHICRQCAKSEKKHSQNPGTCDICDRQFVSAEKDDHLLLRCHTCQRAFCSDCVPLNWDKNDESLDHQASWDRKQCTTCTHFEGRIIDRILTWRHVDNTNEPTTTPLPSVNTKEMKAAGITNTDTPETDDIIDEKTFDQTQTPKKCVYLVKWEGSSYRHLNWVPGSWVAGVSLKNRAFIQSNDGNIAQPLNVAVPKSWKTIDRILDVKQTSSGAIKSVYAKFSGLPYDESCWDTPPFESDLMAPYREALRYYRMIESIDPPTRMIKRIKDARSKLKPEDFGSLRELKSQPPYVANGTLLPHQLDGLNWLQFQWERKQACILADDMGLGKTIQVVTFLDFLLNKYKLYPFLLVVPNSTATNWVREFNKWAPDMIVVPYFGSRQNRDLALEHEIFRNGRGTNQISCHAVIMTYESALQDVSLFSGLDIWPYLVVDEAQRLKNTASLLFKKLSSVKTDNRILLTGTPLQNNIGELINIMNFVDPSNFNDVVEISNYYEDLNHETVQQLHKQLKPYFLRRTKDIVLKNLPPKKEIIVPLSMTRLQKELYKDTLTKGTKLMAQLQKQTRGEKEAGGKVAKQNYNNIMMVLRKILNHPYLLPGVEIPYNDPRETQQAMVDACGKLKLLHIMLPKLFAQGHRVLIFSTMSIALDVLEDYLVDANITYVRLDGGTKQVDRVANIDAFNAPNSDVKVFLLTTRAGGVGINLATSDTVIIYDSDFNPHADQQAISRAHRFGQQNPVLVLRFITRLSVEESIVQKNKKKLVLDHLVVDKMDEEEMESDDVESIIKFGLKALFDEGTAPNDIAYDSAAVDELLNRDSIFFFDEPSTPEADAPDGGSTNMSFSFAKIWQRHTKPPNGGSASPSSELTGIQDNTEQDDDKDIWEKLLTENQRQLEQEALTATENLGRGARKRKAISYSDVKPKNEELATIVFDITDVPDDDTTDDEFADNIDESDEEDTAMDGGNEEKTDKRRSSKKKKRPAKNTASSSIPLQQPELTAKRLYEDAQHDSPMHEHQQYMAPVCLHSPQQFHYMPDYQDGPPARMNHGFHPMLMSPGSMDAHNRPTLSPPFLATRTSYENKTSSQQPLDAPTYLILGTPSGSPIPSSSTKKPYQYVSTRQDDSIQKRYPLIQNMQEVSPTRHEYPIIPPPERHQYQYASARPDVLAQQWSHSIQTIQKGNPTGSEYPLIPPPEQLRYQQEVQHYQPTHLTQNQQKHPEMTLQQTLDLQRQEIEHYNLHYNLQRRKSFWQRHNHQQQ